MIALTLSAGPVGAASPRDATLAQIRSLALTGGPYAGALRLNDAGGINWYFANIALTNALPALVPVARGYLDAFLAHLDRTSLTIDDVAADDDGRLSGPQLPDSHDAYAGTFLLLAARYIEVTHDTVWWQRNRDVIKDFAYANILTQIKDDGLVRTFQGGHVPPGIDPHEAQIAYLIDNCEVYAGLQALSRVLAAEHDTDASYYAGFVAPLGEAIAALFDEAAGAWRPSDDVPTVKNSFYPDCLAQIYPALYDVSTGSPAEDRGRDARSYTFVREKCHPPRSADDSQRLAIAAYALRIHQDARFARTVAGNAHESHDLPALAWRLVVEEQAR